MDNLVIEYNLDLTNTRLLSIATELRKLRFHDEIQNGKGDRSETIANIQLAVRHIEDARHRITQAARAHMRPSPATKDEKFRMSLDKALTEFSKGIGPSPISGGPVGPQCGCSCCGDCASTHTDAPAPSAEATATVDEMIQTLKDEEAKGQGQ